MPETVTLHKNGTRMTQHTLLRDILNFCFPRKCPVCGDRLYSDEPICLSCLSSLPHTHYHRFPDNRLMERLSSCAPIQRAGGYFFYKSDSPYHQIVHLLKYRGCRHLCIGMGRLMAIHIGAESDFFKGVDALIPVPLHRNREQRRGYNQSALLARGISEVVGIPVVSDALLRVVDNPTQTHLSDTERWVNVQGIFGLSSNAVPRLQGKHLMLVDDVTTTGATLTSCAKILFKAVPGCRISVVVLGVAE